MKNQETSANPEKEPKATPATPVVEESTKLTHAEQAAEIEATLTEATAAGLPSAAAFKAMWKLACTFHASGMFRDCNNPSGCFVKMMLGEELGLKPIQAMMNIDIIEGSPAMCAQLMLAKFNQAGGTIEIKQRDELGTVLNMSYEGQTIESSFMLEDANRAGLQDRSTHSKYPRAMMFWRAISDGIKVVAPGALLKAYTFGELTNDTRHLSGYLTMSEGVEENTAPANPPAPSRAKKQPQAQPGKKPNGGGIASRQMIGKLEELLASAACPVPFQDKCKGFIAKYTDKWQADIIAKWMFAANKFCWKVFANDLSEATDKQLTLLRDLLNSSAVPEFERTNIHTRIAAGGFRKRECSAFIECCEWYIRNKDKLNGDDDPKTETKTETATLTTSDAPADEPGADSSSNGDDEAVQQNIMDENTTKAMLLTKVKEEMAKRVAPKRGDMTKLLDYLKTDLHSMTILDLDSWHIAVCKWKQMPSSANAARGDIS